MLSFNFHDSLNRDVCFVLKGLVALVEVHQRASSLQRWIVLLLSNTIESYSKDCSSRSLCGGATLPPPRGV